MKNIKRAYSLVEILVVMILLSVFSAIAYVWLKYDALEDEKEYFKNNFYSCSGLKYESLSISSEKHKIICYRKIPSWNSFEEREYYFVYNEDIDILKFKTDNIDLVWTKLDVNNWAIYNIVAGDVERILYLPF